METTIPTTPAAAAGHLPREVYARAERFLPWHAEHLVLRAHVDPEWLDGGDRLWYRVRAADGWEVVLVETATGRREVVATATAAAAALAAATGETVAADSVAFERAEFDPAPGRLRFDHAGGRWQLPLDGGRAERLGDADVPLAEVVSPDGRLAAFVRDGNLWLRETATGAERPLTTDGTPGQVWATAIRSPLLPAGIARPCETPPPCVLWSPDSHRLVTHRIDERGAGTLAFLQTVPLDGSHRLRAHTAVYPLPGDDPVPAAELVVFDAETGRATPVAVEPLPMLYYGSPLLAGPPSGISSALTSRWVWWTPDAGRLYVLRRDRGNQSYALFAVEPATGAAREVVRERAGSGIDPAPTSAAEPCVRVLPAGEVVWFSQRDGWGHLYLYDGATGALVRQLTRGAWDVAEIAHVDGAARQLYVVGVGREPGDPYRRQLYRVPLDGGEPVRLTPEAADHTVHVAPNGQGFVDTVSTVETPPLTVLRRLDGTPVAELERAEITPLLAAGWRPPERFCAKARDGLTDVWGVLLRPSDFDPARRYPVLDYIYGGPQVNQAPCAFADLARGRSAGFWQAQALAELGFVVVMIDGLGMPFRGKAYHDVSYRNVADGGIPDHIAALRQLADRDRSLDLERVGIYGHSAGGYASARAILAYPEFYKVAVSSAGLHHHQWDKATWNERYSGPYGPHYDEQANTKLAANLEGKLLLAHGEMDENVHVFNTLRLVDALIKANQDFDLLILPNRPHSCFGDPYLVRRRWDYFVRHLLNLEPPPEYPITGP